MLIGFSGKKQSGKNTSANYILGKIMAELGLLHEAFIINDEGKLEIQDIRGNKKFAGVFDINRTSDAMRDFCHDFLDSHIMIYSFADLLKKEVCIKILGLTYEQCYGTDEQKNSLTKIKWKDVVKTLNKASVKAAHANSKEDTLTGRQVLQIIGTEMFRAISPNVWPEALIRQIKSDNAEVAIITDIRFANEVETIKENGGAVIRLTRKVFEDEHESETALDNFDQSKYDLVINNQDMTIDQQLMKIEEYLHPSPVA